MMQAERYLRKELRRHFLSERERILADVILELSFGLGMKTVKVPKLEIFSDLTGIPRPHALSALQSLHEMRIVHIDKKGEVPHYTINPNSENWKVKIRVARETTRKAVELIKSCNGLDYTDPAAKHVAPLESQPNFRAPQPTPFFVPAVTDSVRSTESDDRFPDLL